MNPGNRKPGGAFATHRQITGTPYIHHAYVYVGNKAVMSCAHRHGSRGQHGGEKAQACADKMLRRYVMSTRGASR